MLAQLLCDTHCFPLYPQVPPHIVRLLLTVGFSAGVSSLSVLRAKGLSLDWDDDALHEGIHRWMTFIDEGVASCVDEDVLCTLTARHFELACAVKRSIKTSQISHHNS